MNLARSNTNLKSNETTTITLFGIAILMQSTGNLACCYSRTIHGYPFTLMGWMTCCTPRQDPHPRCRHRKTGYQTPRALLGQPRVGTPRRHTLTMSLCVLRFLSGSYLSRVYSTIFSWPTHSALRLSHTQLTLPPSFLFRPWL